MNSYDRYYQPYKYPEEHPLVGELSGYGLTPKGLWAYLNYQKKKHPSLLGYIKPLISHDPECKPEFNENFLEEAHKTLRASEGRTLFPIYRQNHTVGLVKEDKQFLLLDSYNAFGAKDADHIPLLRFLRENFKGAQISTLHDKMQNDYHNCAFFTVQNLLKIENELGGQKISLPKFIEQIDTRKYSQATRENQDDIAKIEAYNELGIESIATPACLVPHVQSLRVADSIALESEEFRKPYAHLPYGTHQAELENFIRMIPHRGEHVMMNTNIQAKNREFEWSL